MSHTRIIVLSWVLFSAAAFAQGPGVSSDPLSGEWGADGRTFLDLALDPKGAVSGTVFLYEGATRTVAPVRRGSFDTRTGALRLEGDAARPSAAVMAFTIDGTVQGETLQVTLMAGTNTLTRKLTRMAAQQSAASAQKPGTVLITGSNRGLGFEFAKQYAERGWTVIATARSPESAKELAALAGTTTRITIERLDLLDRPAIAALAAKYRGRPIDLVINNAGVLGAVESQRLGSLDYREFEEVMAVNVYGALAVAEAFREHVAASQQKKIVSITSGSGMLSRPVVAGPYFYNASKAALNMVTRVLATDLRDRGVIVVALAPGVANTDMRREAVGVEQAAKDPPPAEAVAAMMKVIDGLTPASSSALLNVDGRTLPW